MIAASGIRETARAVACGARAPPRASPTANDATKLGSVAPMPQAGGSSRCTWSTHHCGPVGERNWYVAKSDQPCDEHPNPPRRRFEDVVCVVAEPAQQPVGEEHGEQRHEERAEQEEEGLEARELEREAPMTPTDVVATISSRCGAAGKRFCSETAPE